MAEINYIYIYIGLIVCICGSVWQPKRQLQHTLNISYCILYWLITLLTDVQFTAV